MEIPTMNQSEELGMQVAEQSNLAVEIPQELADTFNIANNMEGVIPRLPQIGIIHRGQLFEMPDESKVEDFEGVILDQHPANAWWEKDISESGGNSIPDCFSMNGINPAESCENTQSTKCSDCKQNQFGSDTKTGKGKACKNMKRLHVLMEGSLLPRRLTIPPTSIKSFEGYMTGLVDRGLPYNCVVTKFSLAKKTSDTFEYAEVKLIKDRVLKKEELVAVAGFIKQYKDESRKQEIHADEYVNETEEDEPFSKGITENEINNGELQDDIPF